MMKSEKSTVECGWWELARHCPLVSEFAFTVMGWTIPFGKYEGTEVADIPVTYLFETIADMRASFVVTAVRRMLKDDSVLQLLVTFSSSDGKLPRGLTLRAMLAKKWKDAIDFQRLASSKHS